MKPKNFTLAVLFLAIIGLGLWWFTQTPVTPAEKDTPQPLPGRANPPVKIAPNVIAPPTTLAVTQKQLSNNTITSAPIVSTDPQGDLKTAIPDIARLIRSGDQVTRYQTYSPPDKVDPKLIPQFIAMQQELETLANQNPQMRQDMQTRRDSDAQSFENLLNQTPTFNSIGNEATFSRTGETPSGNPGIKRVTFVLIDGKWYEKPTN